MKIRKFIRTLAITSITVAVMSIGTVQIASAAVEKVRISGFTWPGYGFWFIAKEKKLAFECRCSQ